MPLIYRKIIHVSGTTLHHCDTTPNSKTTINYNDIHSAVVTQN